jgi:DNA mismatch repair protein MutS
MIQDGVSPELDEMIRLTQDTQSLLAEMEAREKEATGITSLKIRYNSVFGYYIEVTNTHKDKVPLHYQRKQTLTNAERFCTDELIELEKKVLTAQTKRADLEWVIYDQIRKEIVASSQSYLSLAQEIAEIDVLSGLAWLAIEQNYCRPMFNDQGTLRLMGSRHPVVEQELSGTFIPNNIHLEPENCMLLTGPNMAGKSTLMRQVAVTAMLAQMGSYVPCEKADLPLFDHIFTRIGASDHLSEGLSTFMVEMTETAEILRHCTSASLVILDEVGRGTSTFDGLSLAQSILEHLLTQKKTLTFFATHYHELTELEGHYVNLTNYHMAVSEQGTNVQFLHTLIKGPALKSYGIYVAELAGLPTAVTRRAKSLLKQVEAQKVNVSAQLSFMDYLVEGVDTSPAPNLDTATMNPTQERVFRELQELSLGEMTPIKALNCLAQWQEILKTNGL